MLSGVFAFYLFQERKGSDSSRHCWIGNRCWPWCAGDLEVILMSLTGTMMRLTSFASVWYLTASVFKVLGCDWLA